ncbi:hypothetical protein G9P44_001263 [Scheffersomyces stipitis]|nr:hypothetical protein G9P44_001263 [Scheffersomyces stipitis]
MNPDETTRLLRNANSSPVPAIRLESGPTASRLPSRPPLFSIPSSQSVRSYKSLNTVNDPIVDSYLNANSNSNSNINNAGYGANNSDDSSSIARFNVFKNASSDFDFKAYVAYYLPILNWLPNYDAKNSLLGDTLAGLSLASFQMPLVMSIATSLAHLPPVTGLYSIIAGATVYAIFGCVPVLVVGPSPSSAIIYGQVIEQIRHAGLFESFTQLELSSAMSFSLSAVLLGAGFLRFGYLDNVLSRALLKGFIAAMGFIMIINEFSSELGMLELSKTQPHLTNVDKVMFVVRNWRKTHVLSACISGITLAIVLAVRYVKGILVSKHNFKSAVYFPELMLMVVITTILCRYYRWDLQGVDIVGDIASGSSASLHIINPIDVSKLALYKHTFHAAFLCTILGYFDSTTATKALGAKYNYNVSSNRELIALGSTNLVVSLVSGMPSFGAFGRSKINLLAGATTPMAGLIMAAVTLLTISYLLPLIRFLPECVLALTTTIIGITVLQEVPHDLQFFWNIRGYDELTVFFLVMLTTVFWSAQAGLTLGVLVAIARVIKHSSRSRIQIMGRVPNTNVFRNADTLIEESFAAFDESVGSTVNSPNMSVENLTANMSPDFHTSSTDKYSALVDEIEQIEGVLLIKIPEPLNFANVSNLKSKLSRIEKYGTLLVHPSQPTRRDFNNNTIKFIIFDCKGMNSIDSSATQVLYEVVRKYTQEDKINVCFSRVPADAVVRDKFRMSGITEMINGSYHSYSVTRSNNSLTNMSSLEFSYPVSLSGMGDGFFLSIDQALKSIDLQNV